MIRGREFGLEVGEFLKEGIGTHSKAKTSRGAPLDDAGQNKIKKSLKTTRNIDSIVMKEKGIKEKQETQRKTISLKDSLDPSMTNARKRGLEVPKSKHRFRRKNIKVREGPGDSIKIDNV